MRGRFTQSISGILLLAVFSMVFIQCSKDDDKSESADAVLTLSTADTAVLPLQAVIVESDTQFSEDSYRATFGGQQIEVYKTEAGKLIFPVPDVSPGNYNLELAFDGKKGTLEFTVGVSEFTPETADEAIQQELKVPLTQYRNELDALASITSLPQALQNQIATSRITLDRYLIQLENISDQEKIQLARFYEANPFFTSDFLNAQRNTLSNPQYDCFKVNRDKVILTVISVATFVDILPTLVSAGPWGSVTAVVGLVAGVTAAVCIISAAQELLINDCLYPYKQFLVDQAGSVNNFTTNNAQEIALTVKSINKGLSQEITDSGNAFVSSVVEKLNFVKGKWVIIKNGVNNIVSSASGWFSGWFDESPAFSGITYEFAPLPATSDETESETNTDFITVEGLPADVVATVSKSGATLNLKLETASSNLPRTVTGKIKYNDGDFETEDIFTVTLEAFDCSTSDLAVSATIQGNSATATATGGQPPYSYQWNNGATGASISELDPGTYTVTVTDGHGCNTSAEVVIEEIVFNYAGTWLRRIYNNGNLYQDNEIVFDSQGNSISAQSNIYPSGTGWVEDVDNWKLEYDDGFITITNLYWGTSLSFEVNDPDASQFYLPGQENFSDVGDWWTLIRQ